MNEQALMQILADHLRVTELLFDDFSRLAQSQENFSISAELLNKIQTMRAQRQRVQAIVGQ